MTATEVMASRTPGSGEWSWHFETVELLNERHIDTTRYWINRYASGEVPSIIDGGPILLGNDGRVWDGHHRIVAAWLVDPEMVLAVEIVQDGAA